MNRTIFISLFCLLMVPSLVSAQVSSKEEKKFWKAKAKKYVKNPLELKAEFKNMQAQIDDLKQRNKELTMELSQGAGAEVDSLRWALIQAQGELDAAQAELQRLRQQYSEQSGMMSSGTQPGLVYRVQIGAYVFHQAENIPQGSEEFVSERADGFNKYLIGSFRTYEEAALFRDELETMGMQDPWVVPYIDGKRASIDEANAYLARQGKTPSILD